MVGLTKDRPGARLLDALAPDDCSLTACDPDAKRRRGTSRRRPSWRTPTGTCISGAKMFKRHAAAAACFRPCFAHYYPRRCGG